MITTQRQIGQRIAEPPPLAPLTLEQPDTFGTYLRFLRRRARLTQTELSIAVGYSSGHISMLETDRRLPDLDAIGALFVTTLQLLPGSAEASRLYALAKEAHQREAGSISPPTGQGVQVTDGDGQATERITAYQSAQLITHEAYELGQLESIPALPSYYVRRSKPLQWLYHWLPIERQVAVVGLAGMGKTTLAADFAHDYAAHHPVLWITIVPGVNQSLQDILRQVALFVVASTELPGSSQASNQIMGGDIRTLQRYLANTKLVQQGQAAIVQLLTILADGLNRLCDPLIVIDDAHLLAQDQETLRALQQLAQMSLTTHMLFATRSELPLPTLANLTLAGLEESESDELIDKLTTPATARLLDNTVIQNPKSKIKNQNAGSPLLIRLALSQLDQAGVPLSSSVNAWRLVESVLSSLPLSARRLLEIVSLCRVAVDLQDAELVELLNDQFADHDHHAALRALHHYRLIEDVHHAVPHALLREPVLAALNLQPTYRQRIHQLIAAWAEARNDWVEAAHHICALGDLQRACDLLSEGLDAARDQGKQTVAVSVADQILLWARKGKERHQPANQEIIRRTLLLRGDLLLGTLRSVEAYASYREAMEITNDRTVRATIAERMADSLVRSGQAQDALDLCDEAERMLGLTPTTDAIKLRLQFGGTRVRALFRLARFAEARKICEQAVKSARLIRFLVPRVADQIQANGYLGIAYAAKRLGNHPEAPGLLLNSVKAAQAAGLRELETEGLIFLSAVVRDEQGFVEAERYGTQALTVAESIGNMQLVADALHYLSFNNYYGYDLKLALARSQRAAALKEQMNDSEGLAACEAAQAVILGAQGDLNEARRTSERAVATSLLCSNAWLQGIALYAHGVVASFQGELAVAAEALQAALRREGFCHDISFRVGAELYLGIVYLAQGCTAEAQAIVNRPLPFGCSVQETHQRDLLLAMLAYSQENVNEARQASLRLRDHARKTGYLIYAVEAERLAQILDQSPPLADLPRLVCCT